MKKDKTEIFNDIANHYNIFNMVSSFGIEKLWRKKVNKLIIPKGKILDFGCGSGEFSTIIKTHNCSFFGIDPAINMIKIGGKKNKFIRYVNGYGEELPFKDNSFDFIISAFVFRNLKDINKTLSEIRRVLKTGGKVVILEFFWAENSFFAFLFTLYLKYILPFFYGLFGGNKEYMKYLYISIKNFYTVEEFKLLLKSYNFDNIKYFNMAFNLARYFISEKK